MSPRSRLAIELTNSERQLLPPKTRESPAKHVAKPLPKAPARRVMSFDLPASLPTAPTQPPEPSPPAEPRLGQSDSSLPVALITKDVKRRSATIALTLVWGPATARRPADFANQLACREAVQGLTMPPAAYVPVPPRRMLQTAALTDFHALNCQSEITL